MAGDVLDRTWLCYYTLFKKKIIASSIYQSLFLIVKWYFGAEDEDFGQVGLVKYLHYNFIKKKSATVSFFPFLLQ